MKKQNIWLWALTAAVVLLAAALAETQGQLGELQTAYSALQQAVGELRLDLKSTQNRLQEQEEALERAAAQTAPQPEESLLERYELTPLRLDAAAHQVELGVSLTLTTPDQSAEATLNVYQGGAERDRHRGDHRPAAIYVTICRSADWLPRVRPSRRPMAKAAVPQRR